MHFATRQFSPTAFVPTLVTKSGVGSACWPSEASDSVGAGLYHHWGTTLPSEDQNSLESLPGTARSSKPHRVSCKRLNGTAGVRKGTAGGKGDGVSSQSSQLSFEGQSSKMMRLAETRSHQVKWRMDCEGLRGGEARCKNKLMHPSSGRHRASVLYPGLLMLTIFQQNKLLC